jgi:hypothetical protein
MMETEILDEIRAVRDAHAREHNYDPRRLFEELRTETQQLKLQGWKVIGMGKSEKLSSLIQEAPDPLA